MSATIWQGGYWVDGNMREWSSEEEAVAWARETIAAKPQLGSVCVGEKVRQVHGGDFERPALRVVVHASGQVERFKVSGVCG